ncbi:lactoylglutathione lyase [Kitasatospora sp. NPDC015120]|uniref:lactoylglutathione lyase n=1 Tax=Kitasatospora sp. NPDC015120 TaxID=3364023 RepID=UPI0036F48E67
MPTPVPTRPAHPERWFRTRPDSSVLTRPRLLARSLIHATDLDDHIAFYEHLLHVDADLRMPIPDFGGLELAAVGNLLLIASERPFTPVQRRTAYSLIVPSLTAQLTLLHTTATTVLEAPEPILPGARARVRYPDGQLAELVEHRPYHGEQPRTRPRTDNATHDNATHGNNGNDSGSSSSDGDGDGDGGRAGGEGGGCAARDGAPRLLVRRAVPEEEFTTTLRLYEHLLQAPALAAPAPAGPRPAHAALIGDLLLVARTTPDPAPCPTALVLPATPPPTTPATGTGTADGTGARAGYGESADGNTVLLAGGVRAELWHSPRPPH